MKISTVIFAIFFTFSSVSAFAEDWKKIDSRHYSLETWFSERHLELSAPDENGDCIFKHHEHVKPFMWLHVLEVLKIPLGVRFKHDDGIIMFCSKDHP